MLQIKRIAIVVIMLSSFGLCNSVFSEEEPSPAQEHSELAGAASKAKLVRQNFLKKLKTMGHKASETIKAGAQNVVQKAKEGIANFAIAFANKIAGFSTKILKEDRCQTKANGVCDLNALWEEKCPLTATNAEWKGSLFCAFGAGDRLASLIFRLRFTVPMDRKTQKSAPAKHVINMVLTEDVKASMKATDPALPKIVDGWFSKINDTPPGVLEWEDFPAFSFLMAENKTVSAKIESLINEYGLSFAPHANHSLYASRKVDMNGLRDTKCLASGAWQTNKDEMVSKTLFCALAQSNPDHLMARLLGKWKFTAPKDYHNHFIQQALDKGVYPGLRAPDPRTGKQSWTMWGAEKTVNYKLGTVMKKLANNQQLEWNDISLAFVVAGFDLEWLIEPYIVPYLNEYGLDLAS
jgi:hypothetical protein